MSRHDDKIHLTSWVFCILLALILLAGAIRFCRWLDAELRATPYGQMATADREAMQP